MGQYKLCLGFLRYQTQMVDDEVLKFLGELEQYDDAIAQQLQQHNADVRPFLSFTVASDLSIGM